MAEEDNDLGPDSILVHVGDNVEVSDDTAAALNQLAASLQNDYGSDDEVAGFMFEPMSVASTDVGSFDTGDFGLEGMMPGMMRPGMGGGGTGGTIEACAGALRVVVKI